MSSDKMTAIQNKKYLESHKVTKYIEEMMSGLMKEKPDEPLIYMSKFIQQKAQQNGIIVPPQYKLETSSHFQDDVRSEGQSNTRSYEKPWLNNSTKKSEFRILIQQDVVKEIPNQNIINIDSCNKEEKSLTEEFSLVSTSDDDIKPEIPQNNLDEYRKQKMLKDSSNTKEKLLEILKEEETQKNIEKIKLEDNKNEKDLICEERDCAAELAEDQDICQNELNVSPAVISKSDVAVVVRKEPTVGYAHTDNGLKLVMCPNCTKFYQMGNSNGSGVQYSSNSVILDDIESASQVNGPRPISNSNERQYRPSSYLKKISVTDIETAAKAWPVMETSSELSINRKNVPRSKLSSRHFQT